MAPASGTALLGGRYQLGPILGRGGMADVFDGFDTRLQRRVAIKRLRPAVAADPAAGARFEREARAAARLSHPAVVRLYDIAEDGGLPFLVMERMPGPTLADRLAQGPLEQEWLRTAVLQVLGALTAAHEAGILHRDIKPGNVLLAPDGSVKVADFGIAAVIDTAASDEHHTSTGMVIGTPAYLAPERAEGLPATVQGDIYGVGVLLYEGLTGHKPYDGATPLATAAAAQRGGAIPVDQYRPDADPQLVEAASRAMALRPEDRFPSAAAMATALSAPAPAVIGPATSVMGPATEVLPTAAASIRPAVPPVTSRPTKGGPRPRHRGPKTLAALVATAALVVIVVVLWPFAGRTANNLPPTSPTSTPSTTAPTSPSTTAGAPVAITPSTKVPSRHHRRARTGSVTTTTFLSGGGDSNGNTG